MNNRGPNITPPPSLEDILAAAPESRLGQVDFNSRLIPLDDEEFLIEEHPQVVPGAPSTPGGNKPDLPREPTAAADIEPAREIAEPPRTVADDPPLQSPARIVAENPLGVSVEEVAASVIARMREAGEASRRHLESLESEAARRCELLTAQAELDAELIRLHARREAHAIIMAARLRVGSSPDPGGEGTRLNEIGEAFSSFADSIDTATTQNPYPYDPPLSP